MAHHIVPTEVSLLCSTAFHTSFTYQHKYIQEVSLVAHLQNTENYSRGKSGDAYLH